MHDNDLKHVTNCIKTPKRCLLFYRYAHIFNTAPPRLIILLWRLSNLQPPHLTISVPGNNLPNMEEDCDMAGEGFKNELIFWCVAPSPLSGKPATHGKHIDRKTHRHHPEACTKSGGETEMHALTWCDLPHMLLWLNNQRIAGYLHISYTSWASTIDWWAFSKVLKASAGHLRLLHSPIFENAQAPLYKPMFMNLGATKSTHIAWIRRV